MEVSKINPNQIKVDELRFRKDFGDISELADSIRNFGLLQPIVIDRDFNLIAGERRLRACLSLGLEEILVRFYDELDELTAREIELEENIRRKEFTWQEEVLAKAEIDALKRKKYGETPQGSWTKEGWSLRDTARELGQSVGAISQDIQLAKGLELYPELAKEKTKGKALNRLKTLRERELRKALMEKLGEDFEFDLDKVIKMGDCLDLLKNLADNSVDLVVTDPPWGININQTEAGENSGKSFYSDTEEEVKNLLSFVYPELFRVLKPGSHAYVCFGMDYYQWHRDELELAGFQVDPLPIIWDKMSKGSMTTPFRYSNSYSPWFLCWKENPRILNEGSGQKNLISVKRVPPKEKNHPAENPREVLSWFIRNSSEPGDLVLDPFMGGASTLLAALSLQRKALGFEKDPVHFSKAREAINNYFKGNI